MSKHCIFAKFLPKEDPKEDDLPKEASSPKNFYQVAMSVEPPSFTSGQEFPELRHGTSVIELHNAAVDFLERIKSRDWEVEDDYWKERVLIGKYAELEREEIEKRWGVCEAVIVDICPEPDFCEYPALVAQAVSLSFDPLNQQYPLRQVTHTFCAAYVKPLADPSRRVLIREYTRSGDDDILWEISELDSDTLRPNGRSRQCGPKSPAGFYR